jgi:hypothetical protein
MSLVDLLQWLGSSDKSGTLRFERDRTTQEIRFREGRVVGCSSTAPAQRIGQFLISRRKITEEQLRRALELNENSSKLLGQTLVDAGALTEQELLDELRAKTEEIIYSLFECSDGVFRFEETVGEEELFSVDMQVQDILLRGLQRFDELNRIRKVFPTLGVVLRYTSKPPDAEIFADETWRGIYSAIDGKRTIADIVLDTHGSEFQAQDFLFSLHLKGYVEIAEIKELEQPAVEEPPPELAPALDLDLEPAVEPEPEPAAAEPGTPEQLSAELARANKMMTDGELAGALDMLNSLYESNPADDALRRLTAEAEASYLDKAYRDLVPGDSIPVLTRSLKSLEAENLTPQEFFLLSRIDGSWDVKSIINVAPFREVEAARTLARLVELGMVELCKVAETS